MRILQVHNYYQNYGGECHVVDTEKKLLEDNGHEVVQYTRHSSDIDSWCVSKKAITLASIPYNLAASKSISKFIKHVQPDVAHVHNVFPLISPSAYSVLAKASIPVVQTVHNYRFMCPNGMFFIKEKICEECQTRGYSSAVRNRCMRDSFVVSALYATAIANAWRTKIIPDNIARYIVLNRFVFEKLEIAGIPRKKLVICGNFINSNIKPALNKMRYILYLGRLSSEKGIKTLLKSLVHSNEVVLKIAGTGPDEHVLRSYASEHLVNRVEFLGFVEGEEKQRLISQAICLIVPSEWYENFPISVLESLSLGTPVIASRIGGLPDMVNHGATGFLFNPGDTNELSRFINILWENDDIVKQMSNQAATAAETKFNPSGHLKGLIDIYNDAILNS